MLKLSDDQKRVFAQAVQIAAASDGLAEVDAIYGRFEVERAERKPVCDRSGKCCRFESYGHRLFVSTLEVARFLSGVGATSSETWDGTGCPFQVHGACGAHTIRPFGCRVYFCDPTSTDWQQAQYERFHAQIRELHERLGVPYLYVEWREALAAVGIAGDSSGPAPGAGRRSLSVLPD